MRDKDHDDRRWSVYLYQFPDGKYYVGITVNVTDRHRQHRSRSHMSSVRAYAEKIGVVPKITVVFEGLPADQAQIAEDTIRRAGDQTNCLNIGPTGLGIGSVGSRLLPKMTAEERREFNRQKQARWRDEHPGYYREKRRHYHYPYNPEKRKASYRKLTPQERAEKRRRRDERERADPSLLEKRKTLQRKYWHNHVLKIRAAKIEPK